MVGERDERYRTFASRYLGAQVVVVPGAGHGLPRDAPAAVAATKRLLDAVAAQSLDASLDQGAQAFAAALRGTEAGAGIKAFAHKQPAPWAVSGDAGDEGGRS